MAHIGPKVKARREELGWTIQRLATATHLDTGFISRLEREQSGYSVDTEERIAQALNIPVSYLHGTNNVQELPKDHRRIPVLDFIRAGAFSGVSPHFTDEEMQDAVMTGLDVSPLTFAMRIRGSSMEPEFREGDIVVIDPAVHPQPGDFVVAKDAGGEATFKKFRVLGMDEQGRDRFELVPLNPDYAPLRSDRQQLYIVGTMMEHRKPRRRS